MNLLQLMLTIRVSSSREGETVNKGQKIAEMGMSETDSPKLLFEVRREETFGPSSILTKPVKVFTNH